jgi:hypothetical protein
MGNKTKQAGRIAFRTSLSNLSMIFTSLHWTRRLNSGHAPQVTNPSWFQNVPADAFMARRAFMLRSRM